MERQIAEIEATRATSEPVTHVLQHLDEVYASPIPHEQKELFRLVLRRVEVGERQIVLEIYAGALPTPTPHRGDITDVRFGRLGWLPAAVGHSVVVDRFRCATTVQDPKTKRTRGEPASATPSQAERWAAMLAGGEVRSRADLARVEGVSRARVTQVLGRRD